MTKHWDGPTPYPDKRISKPEELVALLSLRQGYRAAMNSPVVVAMYEHMAELRDAWERGVISEHDGKGGTRSNRNAELCNAYESGLKETP